jgi:hypothetical protein
MFHTFGAVFTLLSLHRFSIVIIYLQPKGYEAGGFGWVAEVMVSTWHTRDELY